MKIYKLAFRLVLPSGEAWEVSSATFERFREKLQLTVPSNNYFFLKCEPLMTKLSGRWVDQWLTIENGSETSCPVSIKTACLLNAKLQEKRVFT